MTAAASVSVFCGSTPAHSPALLGEIKQLVSILASRQTAVRMGGMATGLMAQTGKALLTAGVPLTVIYPMTHAHEAAVPPHPLLQHMPVPNLATRLRQLSQSQLCLALPGGLGTWQEIMDCWLHLQPGQRVVLLNFEGYYEPFLQQIAHGQQHGYLSPKRVAQLVFINTVAELEPLLG